MADDVCSFGGCDAAAMDGYCSEHAMSLLVAATPSPRRVTQRPIAGFTGDSPEPSDAQLEDDSTAFVHVTGATAARLRARKALDRTPMRVIVDNAVNAYLDLLESGEVPEPIEPVTVVQDADLFDMFMLNALKSSRSSG